MDEAVDVTATIAALRQQAEARARAMGVTEQAAPDDPLRQAADLAHISAHFPIMWRLPVVGRALSLVKRVVRIGLRWYINPIVDQINDFNEATITALNTLAARQEALAARIAALESAPTPTAVSGQPTANSDPLSAVRCPQQSPLSRSGGGEEGVGAAP